ncbi:calcium-binding protein [Teichococcus aestuarii]|uniref:hypothetical protein n=1 Tax=Teichococcus aestuarii TaxID=568898 RepID=UPI003610F291
MVRPYIAPVTKIVGGPGNDRISGSTLNDDIYGGEGDDWILGGGADYIDGGPGYDVAAYAGASGRYAVQVVGGVVTVQDNSNGAISWMVNVERIDFDNAQVDLSGVPAFSPQRYVASNPDLIPVFGFDSAAAAGTTWSSATPRAGASSASTASTTSPATAT